MNYFTIDFVNYFTNPLCAIIHEVDLALTPELTPEPTPEPTPELTPIFDFDLTSTST